VFDNGDDPVKSSTKSVRRPKRPGAQTYSSSNAVDTTLLYSKVVSTGWT